MTYISINTANPDAQRRFWLDVLDGSPAGEGFRIAGMEIRLSSKMSTGGTAGTVLDHIGLQVKALDHLTERLARAAFAFDRNPNGVQAMVTGPDGVRVELSEDPDLPTAVAFHHYHFYAPDVAAIQHWYAENLGARKGKRAQFEAADLPGVNLTFSPSETERAPTAGRALDHIGFNLEIVHNPAQQPGFITDPWGTRIELMNS